MGLLSEKDQFAIESMRKQWKYAPLFIKPTLQIDREGSKIYLWVSNRKPPAKMLGAPLLIRKQAMLVPVSPDLKMVFGSAKIARDYTGGRAQMEAYKFAPLKQGDAIVLGGGKYRFRNTVLAVIFDDYKRTSPEMIIRAVRRGAELASQQGCSGLILPDMTQNIISHPNWINTELRRDTARTAAIVTMQAIQSCRGLMNQFHIWCWDRTVADIYQSELQRFTGK